MKLFMVWSLIKVFKLFFIELGDLASARGIHTIAASECLALLIRKFVEILYPLLSYSVPGFLSLK